MLPMALESLWLRKAILMFQKTYLPRSKRSTDFMVGKEIHIHDGNNRIHQVQEAASGNIFVQMPDVWVNLAHVYFAQGHYALAVKMVIFHNFMNNCLFLMVLASKLQYQNCLRKFYHNTDTQVLLYLARTHYEAEQWQDCKKTLLRAIHLAPSNYTLRFDAGVAMQKFSASTLQKSKRSADEVCVPIRELCWY